MDTDLNNISVKIKRELSDFLGIDMEDVDDETSLKEDLHMDPASITDYIEILSKAGFDTDRLDLTEIETFGDLLEALSSHT
ncbi:MAG: hypothetical protein UT58_C0009G0006 [Microgenomates group bacterium GW2011_GWC1_39_7b]|uniref:Carrier domain-containing protein n=2 Tax=Candidatus Woeseibacteriota TaxID=1752722 RepID=A0A0G0UYL3_9BACT|nr:MAG: hypothetical protein UT17_C0002G0048 [Candidatus Woesebacteria bacterium GW2011_GWB1_39_10]KKR26626.1 MAG: hypothetical protein UT58_C0009G0006 [Microgenomates group bacterium GW2011_GWC1_39_7b]KKR92601.1 MAG: hypothetical protein UU42_C0001G0205 [Candidatus Woesebacteria bacterium GW2011_GWA1_41_13b]